MMLAPEIFLEEYKDSSYFELLKLKNELVNKISDFENDIDMKDSVWKREPTPDVHYQLNLEVLSRVALMLREAFNREYERGEKHISDFYKDMKKNF